MKINTIVSDNPIWCCTNTSYTARHISSLDSMLAGSDWQSWLLLSCCWGKYENRFYDLLRSWVGDWSTKGTHKIKNKCELEQLERLHSEIPPAAPWLPILVIHIRSQVKKRQSQILKFCKKLYTWHTILSCLIRCRDMLWIQPEV